MKIELLTIEEAAAAAETFCAAHFPERMKRADAFHSTDDRLRCIGAGLLIHRVLGVEEHELHRNAYGKLYIPGDSRSFSISHSGRYIAIAVSEDAESIGVDIETIKDRGEAVARRFFREDELEWMQEDALMRFHQIWTMKESVMKADGRGLAMPMDFSVLPLLNGETLLLEDKIYHGQTQFLGDYCLSAAWIEN